MPDYSIPREVREEQRAIERERWLEEQEAIKQERRQAERDAYWRRVEVAAIALYAAENGPVIPLAVKQARELIDALDAARKEDQDAR